MFLETTAQCAGSDHHEHAQFMHQDRTEGPITPCAPRCFGHGAFRHVTRIGVAVLYWMECDFGYALPVHGRKAIQQLADAACLEMVPPSGSR